MNYYFKFNPEEEILELGLFCETFYVFSKDLFMFGGSKNSSHWCLINKDKIKGVCALETTRLYIPDEKRARQVRYGVFKKVRFTCFDTPSGMSKKKYFKSFNGTKLNYRNINKNSVDIKKNFSIKKP